MSITIKKRYQAGTISRMNRAKGPDVWVYRWRETDAAGNRVARKRVVGTVEQLKSKSDVRRQVQNLQAQINAQEPIRTMTVAEAWGHFQAHELNCSDSDRSPTTVRLYLDNFRIHIIPRWGATPLTEVKPVAVEAWLRSLTFAPTSKSKLRNHMSALFSHAIRHELFDRINPIASVRQGSKRVRIPDILSLVEMQSILIHLAHPPTRLAVLIAAVTGLRKSEIRGLQWGDIEFDRLWLNLRRGVVQNWQTKLKTEASRRGIPIPQDLANALAKWRQQSAYQAESDWIFASEQVGGKTPLWFDILLQNYLRPAVRAAGIIKDVGWHTFRRSLASLLASKGENVKVVQELLRHANASTTQNLYQQADVDQKRSAQAHTAQLFVVSKAS